MFNKLIEFFYPFTDNPKDFVLKNESTWYSYQYRYILYSGNGGKTFKKVHNARQPLFDHGESLLEYNWTFEPMTFNIGYDSFAKYQNRFKSLNDIKEFEKDEYKRFLDGCETIKQRRKDYIERLNNNIKGNS